MDLIEATWNPVTGCSKVSPGCAHCYAEALSLRYGWSKLPWLPANEAENVILHPERLEQPLSWQKPRRVFVNSMSDLFHERVPVEFIADVFAIMARRPQHTFQVLTKRPERMREFCSKEAHWWGNKAVAKMRKEDHDAFLATHYGKPLSNVWLGVSAENQHWADERIPILLDTPAAVRFVSAEPLLGPIDFDSWIVTPEPLPLDVAQTGYFHPRPGAALDWVIVGGESGPKHRPFNPDWARSIVRQCQDAEVACFVKQLGGARPGTRLEELPKDLRIREYPEALE